MAHLTHHEVLAAFTTLSVAEVFAAPDPRPLLERLGYTVHHCAPVARTESGRPRNTTFVASVTAPQDKSGDKDGDDGGERGGGQEEWFALYFAALELAPNMNHLNWANRPAVRLEILQEALYRPLAGPTDSLNELIQVLLADNKTASPSHGGALIASTSVPRPDRSDDWPVGVLLTTILDSLSAEDRLAHQTIAALANPDVLSRLAAQHHQATHGADTDAPSHARGEYETTAMRLYPHLVFGSTFKAPRVLITRLLNHPRREWDTAARKYLAAEAERPESATRRALLKAWLAADETRDPADFTLERP